MGKESSGQPRSSWGKTFVESSSMVWSMIWALWSIGPAQTTWWQWARCNMRKMRMGHAWSRSEKGCMVSTCLALKVLIVRPAQTTMRQVTWSVMWELTSTSQLSVGFQSQLSLIDVVDLIQEVGNVKLSLKLVLCELWQSWLCIACAWGIWRTTHSVEKVVWIRHFALSEITNRKKGTNCFNDQVHGWLVTRCKSLWWLNAWLVGDSMFKCMDGWGLVGKKKKAKKIAIALFSCPKKHDQNLARDSPHFCLFFNQSSTITESTPWQSIVTSSTKQRKVKESEPHTRQVVHAGNAKPIQMSRIWFAPIQHLGATKEAGHTAS